MTSKLPKRAIQIIVAAIVAIFLASILGGRATASTAPPPPPTRHATTDTQDLLQLCHALPCLNNQILEAFDGNHWPIFTVGEYGGASVLGDNFSIVVYRGPTDPFHTMIQLRKDGTIYINGQIATEYDFKFIHCIEKYPLWACRGR